MKRMTAAVCDFSEEIKTLALVPFTGRKKGAHGEGRSDSTGAGWQSAKTQEWMDGMDEEEARDIAEVYFKRCFSEPYCQVQFTNHGRYFVTEALTLANGRSMLLIIDKQSGHVTSLPHPCFLRD
ncbi:MAG: hypothetical protein CVU57_28025 [Deltaproteobacteria bacterium HGW-Deltaproteobacteria-15]|jgi:hypothetical protein|nr:MAG: hypothetical protein CVU57_28025 [Deltaproteobacteria bacterium HGW-Deltaproteobacteria-15]